MCGLKSPVNMRRIWGHAAGPAAVITALAVGAPVSAQVSEQSSSGQRRTAPAMTVELLPSGANGIASSGACVAMGDGSVRVVGGWRSTAARPGVRLPAVWFDMEAGISQPVTLPSGPYGGFVGGIFVGGSHGDDILVAGGTAFDDSGREQPAIWVNGAQGFLRHALPTPYNRGGGGVSVAVGDVNGDGALEIVAAGYANRSDGGRRATVWMGSSLDDFATWYGYALPDPAIEDVRGTSAGYLRIELENVLITSYQISGHAEMADGARLPVIWSSDDASSWEVSAVGDSGTARASIMDGTSNTIVVGEATDSGTGKTLPATWLANSNGGSASSYLLLPSGRFDQGRANGIIAILIGLVVAGDVSGADGRSAAIWVNRDENPVAINLNRVGSNLPLGVRLTTANCILPYMEQANVFAVVGDAVDSHGRRSGYVARSSASLLIASQP